MYVILLSILAYIIYKSSKKELEADENPVDRLLATAASIWNRFEEEKKRIQAGARRKQAYQSNKPKPMTKDEARSILDIGKDASKDEVSQAFRRLMMSNHPDKGGSRYLAGKIIEARDVLLDE